MSLLHLNIDAITESDLGRLIADGVEESKTLEFKLALNVVTYEQKQEFLSDVSAMANTDGGDIIFGVRADKGVAVELVGLRNLVPDDTLSKMENLLRDFIQPRLSGVQIKTVPLANGNHAMLVRTPRSFAAPHMVRHKGISRFCGRNSNGKYDLDVHELRSAFLANETLSERLKAFRIERINRLVSGNAPVQLAGDHLIVLHLLPVVGARANTRLATADLERVLRQHTPRPIAASGWNPGYNFDGLLVSSSYGPHASHSYVQILRSGFLEAVESQTLEPRLSGVEGVPPKKFIPSIAWELRVIKAVPNYLKALAELGLPPPYVASLSLLNVRDYIMYVGPGYYGSGAKPVDRDHLLTDEMLLESVGESPDRLFRPLFDQVWNACGWERSINYDDDGNWRERG